MMNREEILQKAQDENKGRDIVDLDAQRRGTFLAYMVGLALIVAVNIVEIIMIHHVSYSANLVMFAMISVVFFTKYRILRKRHELVMMVIYGITALASLVMWILWLCGVIS